MVTVRDALQWAEESKFACKEQLRIVSVILFYKMDHSVSGSIVRSLPEYAWLWLADVVGVPYTTGQEFDGLTNIENCSISRRRAQVEQAGPVARIVTRRTAAWKRRQRLRHRE